MHVAKFDKGGAKRISDHVLRTRETVTESKIDATKTHLNETLVAPLPPAVLAEYDKLAKRKDAVVLVDVVLTLPEELKYASHKRQMEFFRSAEEAIAEHVGGVVAFAEVHYDETTPHLHHGAIPITTDGRLCAKEICNRKMLKGLHPTVEAHVREQGFDVRLHETNEELRIAAHASGQSKRDMREYRKHMAAESAREQYEQETDAFIRNYQQMLKASKRPVKRQKGESKEDFKQRKQEYVMVRKDAYEACMAFRYDVQAVEKQAEAEAALRDAEKLDRGMSAEYGKAERAIEEYTKLKAQEDREINRRANLDATDRYREWINRAKDDIGAGACEMAEKLKKLGQDEFVEKVMREHGDLAQVAGMSPNAGKLGLKNNRGGDINI